MSNAYLVSHRVDGIVALVLGGLLLWAGAILMNHHTPMSDLAKLGRATMLYGMGVWGFAGLHLGCWTKEWRSKNHE